MSDYGEIQKKIRNEIQSCSMLKEAQVPESAHAHRYQDRVTALTNMLLGLERGLPRLRALDKEIRVAEFDREDAFRAVQDGAAPFPRAAAWTGALGAAGLFGSLGLGLPWFVTAISILLALVSGLCVMMAVRRRRDDYDNLHRARAYLADLYDERNELLPGDVDDVIEAAATRGTAAMVPVRVVNDTAEVINDTGEGAA